MVVTGRARVKVNALILDEMTDQCPFSSWLDTPLSGIKGAVEGDCAGAVGLAAGWGLAVSRVLVCCLSFCRGSSCGSPRGPTSLVGTGVLCCCGAGEDPHAHCCPSLHSAPLVPLDNRCWCQPGCGTSAQSCDATSGPQTVALSRPRDEGAACAPWRCPCPGHDSLFSPPYYKDDSMVDDVIDCALLGTFVCGSRGDCLQGPIVLC